MKRFATITLTGIMLVGCGGGQEASAPSVNSTTKVEAVPSTVAESTPKKAADPTPAPNAVKKNDDPPGLVLPDEPEGIGAKPPELPIR